MLQGIAPALLLMLVLPMAQAQAPDWAWTGAVETESATVQTGWSRGDLPEPMKLRSLDGRDVRTVYPTGLATGGVLGTLAKYEISNLKPGTDYHYSWKEEGVGGGSYDGQFSTFGSGRQSFSFAFGSCAGTGSRHPVFAEILGQRPLFFLHTGDLHYEDIAENETSAFYTAYSKVFGSPEQNQLFSRLPVIYMWDDHDYGPNNSDRSSPSREAALLSYRTVVPHYPLVFAEDPLGPVSQAFSVGRVRFLLTDLRSARSLNKAEDNESKSMLGQAQLDWFKAQLLEVRDSHALIVWLSSVPWIAEAGSSNDNWASFSNERRQIADFIKDNGITNLLIVSGDSHMLAADDGSNNRFSTDGEGPGFPVFHGAALDRRGSVKGGPYSEGTFPGPGQFGMLKIEDAGDQIHVQFEGRNEAGEVLVEHSFTRPVDL